MWYFKKIQKILLFLLIFIQACLGAYSESSKLQGVNDFKADPFVPLVDIPRLKVPPKIDGVINENEWSESASIDNLMVPATHQQCCAGHKMPAGVR